MQAGEKNEQHILGVLNTTSSILTLFLTFSHTVIFNFASKTIIDIFVLASICTILFFYEDT